MRERKRLEEAIASDEELARRTGDIAAYFELAKEGENVESDLSREFEALRQRVGDLETRTLLSGENDLRNAIVTIHPGAGGTESQDWAEMLMRMYLRWAERHGMETVLNDYQPGEEAGMPWRALQRSGESGASS
jgi:peptide chain release factor 2